MIIIEGLDGTGKTTLANDLLNKNYILINNNLTSESHYDKYVNKGMTSFENAEDYNSHNTKQLDLKEMKQLLLQLDLFN